MKTRAEILALWKRMHTGNYHAIDVEIFYLAARAEGPEEADPLSI